MQMRALVAALLVSAASASQLVRNVESPVTKVVELVSSLKAKVEADGESEQASYDKFACWCEDTLGEKATEISEAKETIEKTQTLIVKLKSEISSHQVEIKQLEKDIAANIESTREATEMREKESEGYEGEKSESEQCIGALEAAIKILTGAGENRKEAFLGTLQEAQLLGVTAGLKSLLRRASVEKSLKEQDLEVMRRFVDKPEDFVGGSKADEIAAVQIANNPFGDYAPQSTQIQGILKSMYDSFTSDLEKANVDEAKKQKSFEELMETKTAEKKTLEGSLETHTSSEADKSKELADSKTLLDDTKAQLESDEKFFASTKDTCKTKAGDWATRSRIRTEEIQAMQQAIDILTSDEAKEQFKQSAETFVQTSSVKSMGPKINAAYVQLRNLATKYQSLSLARLATSVTTAGHFDKVMNDIDKMIAILRQEEQDDIKQRDTCERQENKNKNQMEDLNYEIKKSAAMLARLGDDSKALEDAKKALEDDMTSAKKEMTTMSENRQDERDEHLKATKHDQVAVELLEKAISKLSGFYNGADKAAFVQKKADPMPETSFQGKDYKGRQGEGQGIISILTLVKDDIVAEIKVTAKDDGEAQVNFESDYKALMQSWRDMEASKLSVEKRLAQLDLKINDVEEHKGSKEGDLSGEEGLEASIGTNCKWVETHFGTRATKRKNEIDGLVDAKNFLAGME
mmetsp:Transcript_27638/g.82393  ORF Transcript_27638/g.82393 Transcript_27638/m.82393 type:complete len:691 (-) Transcript_27638:47-2119(-)